MKELNPKCVYSTSTISEILSACGLAFQEDLSDCSLLIGKTKVQASDVEWGEKGISPLHVLSAVINAHGYEIQTRMTGTGFRYRNLLSKLADAWGINNDFL